MAQSTTAFHNRIVLAFDFDETLAPPTAERVIAFCGYDPDEFKKTAVQPLIENAWEKQLAEAYALVNALKRDNKRLTEKDLQEIGHDVPLFEGVPEMFDRVRACARAIVADVDIRFYMLTAGFAEVPQNSAIAHEFDGILGGAFHFDAHGCLDTAKRIVTHAEKVRYLLQIAKGLALEGANPSDVYQPRPMEQWRVPVDQMIYLGDGSSDLPAFQFMRERGGIAIGIFAADAAAQWAHREKVHHKRRVENLAPNSYAEGSELLQSILLAVESIAKRIALRRFGHGE